MPGETPGSLRVDDWQIPRELVFGTTAVVLEVASRCEDPDDFASSTARHQFKTDFLRELDRLDRWSRDCGWHPRLVPHLKVRVSHEYRISKSLVPAWYGELGQMRFPTSRITARRAAIAHELVHVYFPNGNRLLAEGLAIHLQAAIGGNAAFPNFGRPLHVLAHALLGDIAACAGGTDGALSLLPQLDAIATPSPLTLQVGPELYDEDARGQAHLYPLAGSFVQFLIETRGLATFRELYQQTPFVPRSLNGGAAHRWIEIYGLALPALEDEWRDHLSESVDSADVPNVTLCN